MVCYHFIGDDSLVEQSAPDSSLNNSISNSSSLESEATATAVADLNETPGPSHWNPAPSYGSDDEENQISEYGFL